MSSCPDLDLAPVAPAGTLERVPVIDLRDAAAQVVDQVGAACREWGFFQATGHGVPVEAVTAVQEAARLFFARPRDDKRRYLRSRGPRRASKRSYAMVESSRVQGETPRPANAPENEWRESPFLGPAQSTGVIGRPKNCRDERSAMAEKGWWS